MDNIFRQVDRDTLFLLTHQTMLSSHRGEEAASVSAVYGARGYRGNSRDF